VAPRRCAEASCVVVRISDPREAIVGDLIPLFARDFTSFAPDAYSRISEETDLDIFLYVIVPALVRALCSLANHCLRPSCPPCHEHAKIFRRLARPVAVARDANSGADLTAARVAQSNQEKQDRAASVPG
jgi:hypothetical protein